MVTEERAGEILERVGVLLNGHFILTSGRHSDRYMQCARLFTRSEYASEMCASLAEQFAGERVDCVIGPALGAVQMAYEVSRHLGCPNMFAERADGVMTLRRGFTVEKGERFLVVEDTVTTGGSVREVIDLVRGAGGIVCGVGAIVDRSAGKVDFGVPLRAVLSVDIPSWEVGDCPLCREGIPAVKPGSRKA